MSHPTRQQRGNDHIVAGTLGEERAIDTPSQPATVGTRKWGRWAAIIRVI